MDARVVPDVAANDVPVAALPLRVQLHGVSYAAAGRRLVDNISTEFTCGPPSIILGSNGAGKSLLLRLCHGLLQPTVGTIRWAGPARPVQAMVFQRPVLLRRSVAANIDYVLRVRGVPRAQRRARTADALARAGLTDLANRLARVLSGGEQQRLALARAWAQRPAILFLDEPTASLDPAATCQVEQIVRAIHHSGVKIVMTTHDLGQARRLAGDVLFLHRGRLLERTAARPFFDRPGSAAAAAFLDGTLLW